MVEERGAMKIPSLEEIAMGGGEWGERRGVWDWGGGREGEIGISTIIRREKFGGWGGHLY